MKAVVLSFAILLSGCSMIDTIQQKIPSFYDDNESMLAVDVRYAVYKLDCTQPQQAQAENIDRALSKLALYSESKESYDVSRMIDPMEETVADFLKRGDSGSVTYCNIKKKLMERQSAAIAEAIMGRF